MSGTTPAAVTIRAEEPADETAVDALVAEAFRGAAHSAPPRTPGGPPGEVDLLRMLRLDAGWIPALSLVALLGDRVVGHVVCSRAVVAGTGDPTDEAAGRGPTEGALAGEPALGLGPVSVLPEHQGRGVGAALVREVLARAEAAGETLVALLGDPAYYGRFGFVPARELGVEAPEPEWGDYFQALPLGGRDHPRGAFRYAAPFDAFS